MNCRHCGTALRLRFADLGVTPPSNAYITRDALDRPEARYPLRVDVCTACWLVQTEDCARLPELFDADYAYFSSYSTSWLRHAEQYVAMAAERFALGSSSLIVEVAANDGYLLQYAKARGIPALGIEPTAGTAAAARAKGIHIVQDFFGTRLAQDLRRRGKAADLMVANNVLAHVPDINDFVSGFAALLSPRGVATFEFPHLMQLVRHNQFDTIYHEHYSYLSLTAVIRIFAANGLGIFDLEELPTHGSSLRVYAQRNDTGQRPTAAAVERMLAREDAEGMQTTGYYQGFQARAEKAKDDFAAFLYEARSDGKLVAAYGAAAKGNTLLNFAGVGADLIAFVVDRNPSKQGKFLPGSRIPIVEEKVLASERPDYIIILPWNLADEIMSQLDYVRAWGAVFVTAIAGLQVR
jgi:SAM-dependent methyltransferase